MIGRVFNIQHFSIHDGPGIRTTVFLKGCNLRCFWCHNPESWDHAPQWQFNKSKCIGCGTCLSICPDLKEDFKRLYSKDVVAYESCAKNCYAQAISIVGFDISSEELMKEIVKDKDIYQKSGGGVTFSGGEPLLQADFLREVLTICKKQEINTAIETAACVPWSIIEDLLPYLDLVYCDIKTTDEQKHKEATGQSNQLILGNIQKMSALGTNLVLRTPIIPGFNDDSKSLEAIATFIAALPNAHKVELLPFHGICKSKYDTLNMDFRAKNIVTPTNLESALKIFKNADLSAKIG